MSNLAITLDHVCDGGNHMRFALVLDGQAKRSVQVMREEVLQPLREEEIIAALKVLIRLHARGKTPLQARNNLVAGITVTV